jgi:hypothetical protein
MLLKMLHTHDLSNNLLTDCWSVNDYTQRNPRHHERTTIPRGHTRVNPTVMVIQEWSKQSFHPYHPGVSPDTPTWIFFFLQIYWENAKFQCKKKGLFTHIVT